MTANLTLAPDRIPASDWHPVKAVADIPDQGAVMVRVSGKQIALFQTADGIRACDNRCPHEGYPLSQGSLSNSCILTCNWHNWKFDLNTGENLYGGDQLRTYPVAIKDGQVWVDLTEPPYEERYATIVRNFIEAFEYHEYDRFGREIVRLKQLGADPLDALRLSIECSWQRMKFGWTHAYAGMADWLLLYHEHDGDDERQLACLMEAVGNASFDVLREQEYPYTDKQQDFDFQQFLDAIEREDQDSAVAMVRGGLHAGMQFGEFEGALSAAALAHYNDFGHSLIYVSKVGYLIEQLGDQVAEPLLLSLVREIIFATREDKIPEFRPYAKALQNWQQGDPAAQPQASQWHMKGINSALKVTVKNSLVDPEKIYDQLLLANAISMLSFNLAQQSKVQVSVSGNVDWLDFTHALTFSNAVRKQCRKYPELWPQGLLQMACFSGRNAAFTTPDYDLERWRMESPQQAMETFSEALFNHGQGEYIVSVHLLKTVLAVREEAALLPESDGEILFAALNRFFHSPLKRRQPQRIAYQSLQFIMD